MVCDNYRNLAKTYNFFRMFNFNSVINIGANFVGPDGLEHPSPRHFVPAHPAISIQKLFAFKTFLCPKMCFIAPQKQQSERLGLCHRPH